MKRKTNNDDNDNEKKKSKGKKRKGLKKNVGIPLKAKKSKNLDEKNDEENDDDERSKPKSKGKKDKLVNQHNQVSNQVLNHYNMYGNYFPQHKMYFQVTPS